MTRHLIHSQWLNIHTHTGKRHFFWQQTYIEKKKTEWEENWEYNWWVWERAGVKFLYIFCGILSSLFLSYTHAIMAHKGKTRKSTLRSLSFYIHVLTVCLARFNTHFLTLSVVQQRKNILCYVFFAHNMCRVEVLDCKCIGSEFLPL
jgi:hypothetical protein